MKQSILTVICAAALVSGCQPAPIEHVEPTVQTAADDHGHWRALRSADFPEYYPTYDGENASGLQNGQLFPSIGSLSDIQYNEDGSVDLYFGPELPNGALKSNYLRTVPGKGWFTLLRLYSPTETFFDQSWRPDDFERIQ